MIYYSLKYLVRLFVKLYFKDVFIFGIEKLREDIPTVLAVNHPSAFVEPALIAVFFPVEVHFMTRGDFFKPQFMWFFKGTNQIPIYRQRDGIKNLRKNNESFAQAELVLKEGGRVTIFPEATAQEVRRIRRLKNGAARLVTGTIDRYGITPLINAVVANYENLHRWRSYVFLTISEPIDPTLILKTAKSPLSEITAEIYSQMKKNAIHIADYKDDKWVNTVLQVVTEEWRYGGIKADEKEVFKHLQAAADISGKEEEVKNKIKNTAESILKLNRETKTEIGAPILSLKWWDYGEMALLTLISLPTISFFLLPVLAGRIVKKKAHLPDEFKIPVFLGVILGGIVVSFLLLLLFLILHPMNWILWAYILILPLSSYSFRKWGDSLQKIKNAINFKSLSAEERKNYSEMRQILLKYLSL